MSSLFAAGRPFSPLVGQPGHVRRQSGSAGGSFIAESLGFNRTAPNQANQALTSRSPQQRYQSSSPLDSLSSSNSTSGSSSASSTPQSSAAAAAMHRSNVMNQIAHAQAALSNLKQRTPGSASTVTPSSIHSPMPYPHPGHPHSLTHTPSTLSSASSTPSSSLQQQQSHHGPPTSNLKIKRKIRKNTREKQRRSELNDKFDSLQELLQLGGGQTKVEKYSVLSEAIQVIEMLRKENEELRSERKELRVELRKITGVLEHAFPAQPELAKEFTNKFFPHLSALSPHNVQQQQQQQQQQREQQQQQQQQQLLGGGSSGSGSGGGGSDFQFGGFGSGGSSIATTPSSAAGGAYGGSITSPTSYLLFHQQLQQQSGAPSSLLGGFAFNSSSAGQSGGAKGQPGHRRGNSRNGGSTSSINFQSIYSQGMPGLGMIPPTPTTQSSLASLASINGQHARKQSLTLSGVVGSQHKRQDSLNKAAIDELRINPYFLNNNNSASAAANTATPGQSMSISPTSTAAPASFPFQSVFPSAATTAASALPSASLSSFTHQRQPSTDFKFSLSSLNSLQTLHNSTTTTTTTGGGGLSPSPPVAGTSTFTFPSSSLHGHNRSMSGNNFAVNFNVTIPGGDDGVGGGLLGGVYDSPSAAALFAGGGGGGGGGSGGHGHHLSSGSLGGWVSGVVGGAATDGDMNDVASGDYQ